MLPNGALRLKCEYDHDDCAVVPNIARSFHEYKHRKPGDADLSYDILRTMFDCAITWGHHPKAARNPRTCIVCYRRPPRGRPHDLRHEYTLHAIMSGENLHVLGRLFGYSRTTTTNRYAHLDDTTLSQAAEWVASVIEQKLYRKEPFE